MIIRHTFARARAKAARRLRKLTTAAHPAYPLGARMRRKIYLAQMGAVDMGIDLRRRDVGVPQNLLQDTKVGTARKHMGCKRMAKRVGMQTLDTHQAAVALADGMNGLARYASAVLIQENTRARGDTTSMSRQLTT